MKKGNEYTVVSKGKSKTITATNLERATVKAKQLFPKSSLIAIRRKITSKGKEFNTYYISR